MENDIAEVFNRPSDVSEKPVFKKPVVIGKRPGINKSLDKRSGLSNKDNEDLTVKSKSEQLDHSKLEGSVAQEKPPEIPESSPVADTVGKVKDVSPLVKKNIDIGYTEPAWSGLCEEQFNVEVLKNGTIVQTEDLTKRPFFVIGRLPNCMIVLEHPSISRYHAVLQYRLKVDEQQDQGWYLFDLGSTHGTFLNKKQIPPKVYCRVRSGHVFKFGVSTRMFVLQGPEEDQETESELTVTEIKELRKKQEAMMNNLDGDDADGQQQRIKTNLGSDIPSKSSGIDWGMGEDAEEENPTAENPFAVVDDGYMNEDLYLDDPKKTLRGWFEREGYELEYKVEEKNYAHFVCRVDLPIDSANGAPIIAEASVKGGKKKEAVVQCALEACRILDRHGLLRQSNHESKVNRRKRHYDEDYYSSDEDTFLDRTGAAERKRQLKLKGKLSDSVETFDTLMKKYEDIEMEILEIQKDLANASPAKSKTSTNADIDDLDSYMNSLQAETLGPKKSAASLRVKLQQMEKERSKLQSLINIARPALIPTFKSPSNLNSSKLKENKKNGSSSTKELKLAPSLPSSSVIPEMDEEKALKADVANTQVPCASAQVSASIFEVIAKEAVTESNSKKTLGGPLLPPDCSIRLKNEESGKPKSNKILDEINVTLENEEVAEREKSGLVIRKKRKKMPKTSELGMNSSFVKYLRVNDMDQLELEKNS
nr:EOG090X026V [Eurycercus lamellatus]